MCLICYLFPRLLRYYYWTAEAIKRNPECAKYWYNRGTARTKIMDFYAAYEDINKALELEPNYVKAYARKGNIEIVQKEYHKAIDSFKKVCGTMCASVKIYSRRLYSYC